MSIAAFVFVTLSMLPACDGASLPWGYRFPTAEDQAEARAVEVQIRRGDCNGEAVYSAEVAPGASPSAVPPALAPGCYGLFARARDRRCRWFQEGCVQVCLPQEADRTIVIPLEDRSGEPICADCSDGMCIGPLDDAGLDARVADAPAECATSCGDGTCVGGTCVCPGSLVFVETGEGNYCTNVGAEPHRCGSGAAPCAPEEYCSGGTCMCRPGLVRRGEACVDPQSDPMHCGPTNETCSATEWCLDGSCEDSCGTATPCPPASCVRSFETNPVHCGDCNDHCVVGEVCITGSCTPYRPGVDLASGSPCTSCDCSSCRGDYAQCCVYGKNVICVDDISSCP